MSWGIKRRNTIIFIVVLIIIIPLIVGTFLLFYNPPNCFDGKQNGGEDGIDCGGNCELLCRDQAKPPIVIWERYFQVDSSRYNVISYVENQNSNAGVKNARYVFKLYNKDGVVITEREGNIHLYPKSVTPIIETGLNVQRQIPVKVSFEFMDPVIFEREEPIPPTLLVKNDNYFIDVFPKVTATIQNISLKQIDDIQVIVLLYDVFDNVIGTSSTYIERLRAEESEDVTFTWPNIFDEDVSRQEIVPIYEPVY